MPTEHELDLIDAAAMETHDALDTRPAHQMLTRQIWTALRGLGLTHGSVTCIGMDAATFTGHATPEEYGEAGSYAEWTGPIRPAGDIYDAVLTPQFDTDPPLDVIIANLPYADLHFRSSNAARRVLQVHQELLFAAAERTAAGGFLVALATRHLMDQENPMFRRAIDQELDLLGAVRLPGTIYHPALTPEQTSSTDLLVLRRRLDEEPNQSAAWVDSGRGVFPGGQASINTYFTNYPHHVVGRIDFVEDLDHHTPRMTVVPPDHDLEAALRLSLRQIVQEARANGLTAASLSPSAEAGRSARTPPPGHRDRAFPTNDAPGV